MRLSQIATSGRAVPEASDADAHARGLALTVCGVLLMTPDALFIRLINADTWSLLVWRSLSIAAVFLLLMVIVHGRRAALQFAQLGLAGLIAAIGLAVCLFGFVSALSHTTVANVLVITAVTPLFAALMGWLGYRERPPLRTWIAIAFGLAGIALAVESGLNAGDAYGVAISLVAALGLALNLTILRHHRHVNYLAVGVLSGLITGAIALFYGDPATITGQSLVLTLVLCLGILPTATALFLLGPRYLLSAEVGLVMLLETVLGPFWVWLVLDEVPSRQTMIGGAVVITTLAFHSYASLSAARRRPVQAPTN